MLEDYLAECTTSGEMVHPDVYCVLYSIVDDQTTLPSTLDMAGLATMDDGYTRDMMENTVSQT